MSGGIHYAQRRRSIKSIEKEVPNCTCVSAPLLPSMINIIFVFIYDIVMRITLTLWHRVIVILCLKSSPQHYTTSLGLRSRYLGIIVSLLYFGVHQL